MTATPLPFTARRLLLIEAVAHADEKSWDAYGSGITDSGVLDLVDQWTTGRCEEGCADTSGTCCDYAELDNEVWEWIGTFPTGTVNGREG